MQAGVQEALAKALGLGAAVHEQAVVPYPGGAKVVALAPGGQHQVVVVESPLGQHFLAVFIKQRRQGQLLTGGIHLGQGARFKAVMIKLGVGAVVHRIQVRVNGAGGDFMKARFPDMDAGGIHQGDVRCAVVAELAAQFGDQRQAAGTAANDNNFGFAH